MTVSFELGRKSSVREVLRRLSCAISDWRARRRHVRNHRRSMTMLARLDDRLLCDVGLLRAEVEAEAISPGRPMMRRFPMA